MKEHVPATVLNIARGHPLAPVLFLVIYTAAGIVYIPTTILKIAGGSIFGPFLGFYYCLIGVSLGTAAGFILARLLGSDFAEKLISGERYRRLRETVLKKREQYVLIVRFIPGIPFNAGNLLAGLLKLRFWIYFPVSIAATLPSLFLFTYFSGEITNKLLLNQDLFYTLIFFLVAATIFSAALFACKKFIFPKLLGDTPL